MIILLIFYTGCFNPGFANPDLNIWSGFGTADLDSSEPDTDFPVLDFSNQKFILKSIKNITRSAFLAKRKGKANFTTR